MPNKTTTAIGTNKRKNAVPNPLLMPEDQEWEKGANLLDSLLTSKKDLDSNLLNAKIQTVFQHFIASVTFMYEANPDKELEAPYIQNFKEALGLLVINSTTSKNLIEQIIENMTQLIEVMDTIRCLRYLTTDEERFRAFLKDQQTEYQLYISTPYTTHPPGMTLFLRCEQSNPKKISAKKSKTMLSEHDLAQIYGATRELSSQDKKYYLAAAANITSIEPVSHSTSIPTSEEPQLNIGVKNRASLLCYHTDIERIKLFIDTAQPNIDTFIKEIQANEFLKHKNTQKQLKTTQLNSEKDESVELSSEELNAKIFEYLKKLASPNFSGVEKLCLELNLARLYAQNKNFNLAIDLFATCYFTAKKDLAATLNNEIALKRSFPILLEFTECIAKFCEHLRQRNESSFCKIIKEGKSAIPIAVDITTELLQSDLEYRYPISQNKSYPHYQQPTIAEVAYARTLFSSNAKRFPITNRPVAHLHTMIGARILAKFCAEKSDLQPLIDALVKEEAALNKLIDEKNIPAKINAENIGPQQKLR